MKKSRQIIWNPLLLRPVNNDPIFLGGRGWRHVLHAFTTTANRSRHTIPCCSAEPQPHCATNRTKKTLWHLRGDGELHLWSRCDCSSMFRTSEGMLTMKNCTKETKKKGNKCTKKKKETHTQEKNVQIDMLVKKYCAFGCPVYSVYNILLREKRVYTCTLDIQ